MGQTKGFSKYNAFSNEQNQALTNLLNTSNNSYSNAINALQQFLPGGSGYQQHTQTLLDQYKNQVLPQIAQNYGGNRSSSSLGKAIANAGQDMAYNHLLNSQQIMAALAHLGQQGLTSGMQQNPYIFQQKNSTVKDLGNLALGYGSLMVSNPLSTLLRGLLQRSPLGKFF